MDLTKILKKTESRNKQQIKLARKRASIATDDRPYSSEVINIERLTVIDNTKKLDTNWTQTGHKLDTNCIQTGHKTEHKSNTNKILPLTLKTQTEHKLDTEPNTKGDTNWTQTTYKLDTKIQLSTLVGLQRSVINYFYFSCKKNRNTSTESLTIEHIASALNIRIGSVKTTIKRLEQKNYITRVEFKNGRGGWSKYELSDLVYKELLQYESEHKLGTNWAQIGHKLDTELNTEPNTIALSSSRGYLYKEESTTQQMNFQKLSETINLGKLNEAFKKIPNKQFFGVAQLKSILKMEKLTPEVIQESILHFAYGLKHYRDKKPYVEMDNPAAVLFNHLKNGDVWIEPKYLTDEEETFKTLYLNVRSNIQKNIKQYFFKWLDDNKEAKYDYYRKKLPSTHFYGDNEYADLAWKDYFADIWLVERKKAVLELIGNDFNNLIDKIEEVLTIEQK